MVGSSADISCFMFPVSFYQFLSVVAYFDPESPASLPVFSTGLVQVAPSRPLRIWTGFKQMIMITVMKFLTRKL
jgi:hypothetical protein